MKCYLHTGRDAVGYCVSCGNFWCERCLSACEDDKKYCNNCRAKLGRRTTDEMSNVAVRLATKLMVRFKTGRTLQGTTYTIDPDKNSFRITPYSPKGGQEEREIEFSAVNYVALVGSFTGEKGAGTREYMPKGSDVSVTFKNGEELQGFTLKAYSDKDSRFSIIPRNPDDYRISIIVERSAVERMSLGRIPKAQELRVLANNSVKRLILHFYWRHPDALTTIDELASRIERTPAAVERELQEFEREELIKRLTPEGRQLKFTPSKDPVVRQAISNMAKDIEMLYFRKKPSSAAATGAQKPPKSTPQWPL